MNKIKSFFSSGKGIIIPTVVMVCICIVVTGALSGTNLLTKDKILKIQAKTQNDSMKELLSADEYVEKIVKIDGDKITYYIANDKGNFIGNIFITSEKGYGGDDKVMVAIDKDGVIKAVKVLDVSNETPGLGQNTGNPTWYAQFSGLTTKKEISVVKNGAKPENNEINAVTGATISSTAVKDAVNKAVTINNILKDGGIDDE